MIGEVTHLDKRGLTFMLALLKAAKTDRSSCATSTSWSSVGSRDWSTSEHFLRNNCVLTLAY